MLKFISFGSGSSGNCYLLKSDSTTIMLDSGVGVRTLKKYFHDYGLLIADVSAILITHDHADHIKAVGALSNAYGIPVYSTSAVHAGILKNYCVRKKVSSENVKSIEKGETFHVGDLSVVGFDVPHDSNDNVGYRIECEGAVFCLMTDVGHITDTICDNIRRSNYLVIESNHDIQMLQNGPYPTYLKQRVSCDTGHLDNLTCAQALCQCYTPGLKHVWLCHLSEENNHPELVRKTMEEEFQHNGIRIGEDIQIDILKRKQPMGFFDLV